MAVGTSDTTGLIVLYDISWQTYENLLAEVGNRSIRLTYNQGTLAIMSPSRIHERLKRLIGRMIEALTEELNIPISSAGSTTFRRESLAQGLEPDECYYIANEHRMRDRDDFDPATDPPPDLAVEVDITHDSADRMEIYAALGVPEIWRHDGESLEVYVLQPNGVYAVQPQSVSFPNLAVSELDAFLQRLHETDETTLIREFRMWVRGSCN